MTDDDALVGLRFEVGGGLGRMTGRVLGKVGRLYLVQKAGAEHMELLELDDLRSAKFYADAPVPAETAAGEDAATVAGPTPKRRLSDQIRRQLTGK